jgi:hypothetical protein
MHASLRIMVQTAAGIHPCLIRSSPPPAPRFPKIPVIMTRSS